MTSSMRQSVKQGRLMFSLSIFWNPDSASLNKCPEFRLCVFLQPFGIFRVGSEVVKMVIQDRHLTPQAFQYCFAPDTCCYLWRGACLRQWFCEWMLVHSSFQIRGKRTWKSHSVPKVVSWILYLLSRDDNVGEPYSESPVHRNQKIGGSSVEV